MGLKGFPESAKFRHLFFFPGLFSASSLCECKDYIAGRKKGERGWWFRTGQVTGHKDHLGPARQLVQTCRRAFSRPAR